MRSLIPIVLEEHYHKLVSSITEQEGGWSAQAFRIGTTDGTFFLKVYDKQKASTKIWTATIDSYMPIVLWLHSNTGLNGKIVCPVLTEDGGYKSEDERFIYLLFPYIEGYTLCDRPMSVTQVTEIAEIIAELHRYGENIPVSTAKIKENFAVPFCHDLKEIIVSIGKSELNETLYILKEFEYTLIQNIAKTEALAERLANANLHFVLCHTDVHGWNLMQSDRLILIDWEGMKLAPPEADLFAFIGDHFWHTCSDSFMNNYKKIHTDYEINPYILDFYQTRRRIEDIYAFAQGLLFEDIDDEERKLSLYHLRRECSALSRGK